MIEQIITRDPSSKIFSFTERN